MKRSILLTKAVVSTLIGFVISLSQARGQGIEAIRQAGEETGNNTNTTISSGVDRTNLHRDTELSRDPRVRQHAPALGREQVPNPPTSSKENQKRVKVLRQKRDAMLRERDKAVTQAVANAKRLHTQSNEFLAADQHQAVAGEHIQSESVDEAAIRKQAMRDWYRRNAKELQSIDSALQKNSTSEPVRQHAPASLNPERSKF
jgi:hypothetical protein